MCTHTRASERPLRKRLRGCQCPAYSHTDQVEVMLGGSKRLEVSVGAGVGEEGRCGPQMSAQEKADKSQPGENSGPMMGLTQSLSLVSGIFSRLISAKKRIPPPIS